jgi:hypothetical protein
VHCDQGLDATSAFVPPGQQPPLAGVDVEEPLQPPGSTTAVAAVAVAGGTVAVAGAGDSNSSSISGFAPEPQEQQHQQGGGPGSAEDTSRESFDFQSGAHSGNQEEDRGQIGGGLGLSGSSLLPEGRVSPCEPLPCTTSFMPCDDGSGVQGQAMHQQLQLQLHLSPPGSPAGSLVTTAAAALDSRAAAAAPVPASATGTVWETAAAHARVSAAATAFGSLALAQCGPGSRQASLPSSFSSPDRSAPSSAAVTPRAMTPTGGPNNPFAGMIYTSTRTNRVMPFDPASVSPGGSGRSSLNGGRWMQNSSGGWWAPSKGKSLGGTTVAPSAAGDSLACQQKSGGDVDTEALPHHQQQLQDGEGEGQLQLLQDSTSAGGSSSVLQGGVTACSDGLGSAASSAPVTPDASVAPVSRGSCEVGEDQHQEQQQSLEWPGAPLSIKCLQQTPLAVAAAASGRPMCTITPKTKSRIAAVAEQQAAFAAAVAAAATAGDDSPSSVTSVTSCSSRGKGRLSRVVGRCQRRGNGTISAKHGQKKGFLPSCECGACAAADAEDRRSRRALRRALVEGVALAVAGGVALMAAKGSVLTASGAGRLPANKHQQQKQKQQQQRRGLRYQQQQEEGAELVQAQLACSHSVTTTATTPAAAAAGGGGVPIMQSKVASSSFREGGQVLMTPSSRTATRGGPGNSNNISSSGGGGGGRDRPASSQGASVQDLGLLEPTLEVLAQARSATLKKNITS